MFRIQGFTRRFPRVDRSVLLALVACLFLGRGRSELPTALARQEFGFSLNPTAQGELYALFIYTIYNGMVVNSIPMRPEPFIMQMAGLQDSRANIESIDLFEEYGIAECGAYAAVQGINSGKQCEAVQSIWKLRYRGDVGIGNGIGWAGEEFTPSTRQQIILQAYRSPNYEHWHGPYFGKDAFRLLRDIQNPEWVKMYREGG